MVEYRTLDEWDCDGYQKVVINEDPIYVFEYSKTACELADEVNGEVVVLHYSHLYILSYECEEDAEYIGYGVVKDGEVL